MMAEIWSRYSKEVLLSLFKPKVAHLKWLLTVITLNFPCKIRLCLWSTTGEHWEMQLTRLSFTETESGNDLRTGTSNPVIETILKVETSPTSLWVLSNNTCHRKIKAVFTVFLFPSDSIILWQAVNGNKCVRTMNSLPLHLPLCHNLPSFTVFFF